MRIVMLSAVAVVLIACSSAADQPASACADISGNYSVQSTRAAGTCDPKLDGDGKSTLAFSKNADGSYNIVLTGIPGGCPGALDPKSCRYTANCEAKGQDGATVIATFSLDYTFSGNGFSGSSISGLRPPSVATPCDVTYQERGTKL